MVSFESDYVNGAHPEILRRLIETNDEPLTGYGLDRYCESAKEKIKKAVGLDVDVELLTGGTQTNAVVISTMLKDYEAVVATDTGHIATHEGGAIEYTGHKVTALPAENGVIVRDMFAQSPEGYYDAILMDIRRTGQLVSDSH